MIQPGVHTRVCAALRSRFEALSTATRVDGVALSVLDSRQQLPCARSQGGCACPGSLSVRSEVGELGVPVLPVLVAAHLITASINSRHLSTDLVTAILTFTREPPSTSHSPAGDLVSRQQKSWGRGQMVSCWEKRQPPIGGTCPVWLGHYPSGPCRD